MKSVFCKSLLLSLLLAAPALSGAAEDWPALVTGFWQADDERSRELARDALLAAAPDVGFLYRRIAEGPDYSADVPTGEVRANRFADDGIRYPYVALVPDSYDPSRAWPVEFMLHGGVNRDKPAPNASLWRGGYDSVRRDDAIVVIPAAWRTAIWWQSKQAENLPAILSELKRSYHIDDNRVTLGGVSDGGTGAYFFAFKQPSQWAAFFPYIGHPGVLRSEQSGGGYMLYFENLVGKALYMVNGENDPLYPAASLASFVQILADAGVEHEFRIIEEGGHNTRWLPAERPQIESFREQHIRDPYPDTVQWVTDRVDRYNRNHWIRIDELEEAGRPSLARAERDGNTIQITTRGVSRLTLLLNPDEVDFTAPLLVSINGQVVLAANVEQSMEVLLDWVERERDRGQLYTAELELEVPQG